MKFFHLSSTSILLPCLVACLLSMEFVSAQVSIPAPGSAVTEDFNSLANTGTSSTLPMGWAISESGGNANTTYTANNGSSTTGDTYSYGTTSASDRALGGLQSGSLVPTIGGSFQNNIGSTITALLIAYTGEQWRLGAASHVDRLDFQYSTNATSLTTGTWTDVDNLDFTAPITTGSAGPLDGNAAANQTALSFTISSLSIAPGAIFWIRWTDFNATGADDGLSVDNFSITGNPGTTVTNFYNAANSDVTNTSNWWTNPDGATGSHPMNFTADNQIFNIKYTGSTMSTAWTVSGGASKVILGDGTSNSFTIPSGLAYTGTMDVAALSTLNIEHTTNPTFGTIASTSTIAFTASSTQTVPVLPYGNLIISTTGGNANAAGNLTIGASLTVSSGSILDMGTNTLSGASLTTSGTGTLRTQNTGATPIPAGKTWSMTVAYNSSSDQNVVPGNYSNLNLTGGNRILPNGGTIDISGIYTPGAGTHTITNNTINYSGADGQTIAAATYHNITSSNNARTLANGIIQIDGSFVPGSGNYTIGTSTVEFNGTNQTIPVLAVASGANYYNLLLSSTSGNVDVAGDLSVANDFTQNNTSTFRLNNQASGTRSLTIGGNLTLSGAPSTFNMITNAGADNTNLTVTGNINLSSSSVLNLEPVSSTTGRSLITVTGSVNAGSSATRQIDFGVASGTLTNNELKVAGNFTLSAGGIGTSEPAANPTGLTFNGTTQQWSVRAGYTWIECPVTINSGSTVQIITNNIVFANTTPLSNLVINGTINCGLFTLAGASGMTITLGAGATFITANNIGVIGSTPSWPTRTFDNTANYELSGTANITSAQFPNSTMNNLVISNSATTSLGGTSYTVNGNLTLNAGCTFACTNKTISLAGNILGTGTQTYSTGSGTTMTGASKTISGATLSRLTINNAAGPSLTGNPTINNNLTFTNGKITTGSNKVIMGPSATVTGGGTGWIIGNLQKPFTVAASKTFEIGGSDFYRQVIVNVTAVTTPGDLIATVSQVDGNHPNINTSTLDSNKCVKRYYTLTTSNLSATYDATFNFNAADVPGAADPLVFSVGKYNAGWTYPTIGNRTATSTQILGATSFSDFVMGESGTPTVTTSPASFITETTAVLNGIVNANGYSTTASFDYGLTNSYGSSVMAAENPITGNTNTAITGSISSLSVNTQYHFRATATNVNGTTNGQDLTFYTKANVPGTPTVNNPTPTSLDVTLDPAGNPAATQFAIHEAIQNKYVNSVTGALQTLADWQTAATWGTKTVTGLLGSTTYLFEVKARNGSNVETAFGATGSGMTSPPIVPTITSPTVTAITSTTATLGGNVTSNGGALVTVRGAVWSQTSQNSNPQIGGMNVTNVNTGGSGNGVFTVNASSLPSATQISYAAYATNSVGTSYTSANTFYTQAIEPTVQASAITFSALAPTTFTIGWTNGNGGRRAVFMRQSTAGAITHPADGTLYSPSSDWLNPGSQLGSSGYYCIYDGSGSSVNMTNLQPATAYFVRVYEYGSDGIPTPATINYNLNSAAGNPNNAFSLSLEPAAHAAMFSATATSTTSITLDFSAANTILNAAGYVILQKSGATPPSSVPQDANAYSVGNTIGDATVAAIITNTSTVSTLISNLAFATTYSFTIIPYNWNGTDVGTYNYYTAPTIPSATATTLTPTAPVVINPTVTNIQNTTATLGGNVSSDGGDPVIARGVIWSETSMNADPVIGGPNVTVVPTSGTTGIFTVPVTGLPIGTNISYKAYAINSTGTGYTTVSTFTTLLPADHLSFVGLPASGVENMVLSTFTVEARRADNSVDPSYSANVTIVKTTGPGNLSGTLNIACVNGVATFTDLVFDMVGTYTITASSGSLTSVLSGNILINGSTLSTDYFRSVATGNWTTNATWESSHDNMFWFPATAFPSSAANTILIRTGNTVTINTSMTIDQVEINSGGILMHTANIITLNNGTGDDINIQNGGIMSLGVTGTAPTFLSGANVNVSTGGILRVAATGLTGNGAGVNLAGFVYQNASILEYSLTSAFSSSGVTYFPNVNASTIPIFRLTATISGSPGAAAATTFNGLFEIAGTNTLTWTGAGTKTFRNGITGSGTVSQGTAGQFILSAATTEISGTVTVNLGVNGMSVTGAMTLTGKLACGTNVVSGAGSVTVNSGGVLKLGSTSTSGAIAGNITATGGLTLNTGSTVEYNGAAAQFEATRTFARMTMNNTNGVSLVSGNDITINGILTLTTGNITTGTGKVIISNTGSVNRTSGHIAGNLQKNISTGAAAATFEIGGSTNYRPVTVQFGNVGTAGNLIAAVTQADGAHPNLNTSIINSSRYVNRYFKLTNSGIVFDNYSATFNFVPADILGGGDPNIFIIGKYDGAWTYPNIGTRTATSTQLTGATSFSDFVIGEPGNPSVTTNAASAITTTTATLNGSVNARGTTTTAGFDYGLTNSYGSSVSANENPINGNTNTPVTGSLSSLSVNTLYHFRANASNSYGAVNGSDLTFYTLANIPGTPVANNATATTIDVLIDVNSNPAPTEFAIHETTQDKFVLASTGALVASPDWQTAATWGTKTVTGLTASTIYTFEVKARNGASIETAYGASVNDTTLTPIPPLVTTPTATSIGNTTATLGGNVVNDGGATISTRGIVWSETSLNGDPLIGGANVTNVPTSGTTGVFTVPVTGLPAGTNISYKAYATNTAGTSYTSVSTFTTLFAANHLTYVSIPSSGTEDAVLSTFTVDALRPDNSVDNFYSSNITITLTTGPGNLSGTVTQPAVNGIATFDNLVLDGPGTYTLTASSGALTPALSGDIIISGVTALADHFRSVMTGNWSNTATWESSHDASFWFSATAVPTSSATSITVQTDHTVTIDSPVAHE